MKKITIIWFIVVGIFLFCWFGIRPVLTRAICANSNRLFEYINTDKYESCIHRAGL